MYRRTFIKTATRQLAGLVGLSTLASAQKSDTQSPAPKADAADELRGEVFWASVRRQFPLTQDRVYLNTGGLGASPHVSIEALKAKIDELEYVSETGHQTALWRSIKEKAGLFLGCRAEEIAYTRNTTEGVNIVCNGLPLRDGDEVITSTHEHVGNTIAWLARQRRDGIVMKVFEPSTRSAQENLERIEALITPRTRALSISHVTTSTGQILPVEEIGKLASRRGLWYFVDGAQAPGMLPIDVGAIGCHAYATSGHKWLLGPKGTGLLYVRQDALDVIDAQWVGAYSNAEHFDMRTGEFHFAPTAQRYEYGTVSTPLFVGLGAALDFLLDIGIDRIWHRDHALAAALIKGLNALGAEVLSPQHPDEHSAMITFRLPNVSRTELQPFLAKNYNLRTRGIYEGGLDGLRISLHLYNSFADVEKVLEGAEAALKI